MLIHQEKLTLTPSSGSASDNTDPIRGFCHHVIVRPTTETTQYNINIVNSDGITIYERISETGTLTELTLIPVRGIYTINLASSTVDEAFNIQLIIQE